MKGSSQRLGLRHSWAECPNLWRNGQCERCGRGRTGGPRAGKARERLGEVHFIRPWRHGCIGAHRIQLGDCRTRSAGTHRVHRDSFERFINGEATAECQTPRSREHDGRVRRSTASHGSARRGRHGRRGLAGPAVRTGTAAIGRPSAAGEDRDRKCGKQSRESATRRHEMNRDEGPPWSDNHGGREACPPHKRQMLTLRFI